MLIVLVLGGAGFLLGLAFRWWALAAPVGAAAWAGATSELEVSSWWIAFVTGALGATGVALGALARSRLARL